MTKSFSAQVHQIVRKNQRLMTAVAQESTQELINQAQTPKSKGGKMPVDTGFLRASGRLSLTGVPSGPVRPPKDGQTRSAPDKTTIAGFKLGTSIFWGWTAIYARRQELYNGFLSSPLRQWQKTVDGVVRRLRDRHR